MVQTPYGDNIDGSNDARKLKLQLQAQEQYMSQLQQKIANQSNAIEQLQEKIKVLEEELKRKEEEIANYSKRLQEERYWKEEDAKARDERERELKQLLRQREVEIDQLKQANIRQPKFEKEKSFSPSSNQLETYVSTLLAYYAKPTSDDFVNALNNLIKFSMRNGTVAQKILGTLHKAPLPKAVNEIATAINESVNDVDRELFNLEKKGLVKKVGNAYVSITSDYAEATNLEQQDWEALNPKDILKQLKTIVMVSSDKDQVLKAFNKARDTLMETGALTPLMTHAMSRQIDKIRRYPLDTEELIKSIDEWLGKF